MKINYFKTILILFFPVITMVCIRFYREVVVFLFPNANTMDQLALVTLMVGLVALVSTYTNIRGRKKDD